MGAYSRRSLPSSHSLPQAFFAPLTRSFQHFDWTRPVVPLRSHAARVGRYDPDKSRKGALCFVGRNVSKRRVADEAFHNPIIFAAGTKEGLKEMREAQDGPTAKNTRRAEG